MNTHTNLKSGGKPRAAVKAEAPPSPPASFLEAPVSDAPTARRVRRPFGTHTQKLEYPKRPGYHRHWFNDKPGRIADALAAGYEHVLDENSQRVPPRPVGVNDDGSPLIAYIMEIPEEWYKEDMAAYQQRVDEQESAIKRGADNSGEPGKDGRYIPSQGISIKTR